MGRPISAFLRPQVAVWLVGAALALAGSALLIVRELRKDRETWPKRFVSALSLNLLSVGVAFATAETAIRALSASTPTGPAFAKTVLLPKSWEQVSAHNRSVMERAADRRTYLVPDEGLGWTVGASRRSVDYNLAFQRDYLARRRDQFPHDSTIRSVSALADSSDDSFYVSSTEGLRSPTMGMSFAVVPAKARVALVGDSFTFGLEVRYNDTWGNRLEQMLGNGVQVLNFGVDGYGVDQALLRYRRDATTWHPDVVILSAIDDDAKRTMCIYGFLCFPASEIPFAKPRFVVSADTLVRLNQRVPSLAEIVSKDSITDLPFIHDDVAFDPVEWESRWYRGSYAIRFVLSRYRRWAYPGETVNDDATRKVNGEIFRSFVREARAHGSAPLVVYLPAPSSFERAGSSFPVSIAQEALRSAGIPYLDMTECVTKVPAPQRFVVLHYSPASNAAVAGCLRDTVSSLLRDKRSARVDH
jgi:hypothetical protein